MEIYGGCHARQGSASQRYIAVTVFETVAHHVREHKRVHCDIEFGRCGDDGLGISGYVMAEEHIGGRNSDFRLIVSAGGHIMGIAVE